jgi:hypothetical protein
MWILFGAPFPVGALGAAILAIFLDSGFWISAIGLGLFSTVHLSWLKTARLAFTDQLVHYRALFVRKDISISSILRARAEFGFKGVGPAQRVVFEVYGEPKHKKITVNAGLFDLRQTGNWVKSLNAQLAANSN